jgi:hypothetical protein
MAKVKDIRIQLQIIDASLDIRDEGGFSLGFSLSHELSVFRGLKAIYYQPF